MILEHILSNTILDTDSYKPSHFNQVPKGTTEMFFYLESRGGKYNHTVFFGLQPIIEKLSQRITVSMVEEAADFFALHGEPFNKEGWMYIAKDLNGKLPVEIRAVDEGCIVPTHNVLVTVRTTDPKCVWLGSYIETQLMRVWYPTTVATNSWYCKQIIKQFLDKSSDDPENEIYFKLHDFGSRGVSSRESAALGGAAHLVNFMGSDTVVGVHLMNQLYNDGNMSAFSIPAMEHSTVTSWGEQGEEAAYANMLAVNKGAPLIACVSDSYDIVDAVKNIWCGSLLEKVKASGTTVVIRPDSGEPVEQLTTLCKIVDEAAGSYYNKKGFKVFNNFRFLWGDGINEDTIRQILKAMTDLGYSATNFAFGMGGALLQQVNRDTLRFAYKCSSAIIDGHERDVFKNPKTDPLKASKKGKLDLIMRTSDRKYETVNKPAFNSVMKTVFKNGEVLVHHHLNEVRERANREV